MTVSESLFSFICVNMSFPVAVMVNLDQTSFTVTEGMTEISVCVNLSELIERNVFVTLHTSNSSSGDSASGIFLIYHTFLAVFYY